jgi:hypothetical protein
MAYINDIAALGLSPQVANLVGESIKTGIAAAGNSQATAAQLTHTVNVIATATGTSADGVKLPTAFTGARCVVINKSGETLDVWPATGDKIEDGSANAAVTQADNVNITYYAVDGENWYGL